MAEAERARAARVGQAEADYRKASRGAWCFAAEHDANGCEGRVINAHTVQRASALIPIATDGHVMGWEFRDGNADLVRVGVNRASTFTGFCARHDNEIFRALDTQAFEATQEQVFQLCLRSVSHECYKKEGVVRGLPILEEAMRSEEVQNYGAAAAFEKFREESEVGLREMSRERRLCWRMLRAGDYRSVGMVAFEIEDVPMVAASGWVSAEYDFQGRHIQDLDDLTILATGTACFILPLPNGGLVGLAWLERTPASYRLFRSAVQVDDRRAAQLMLRFALTYSEDCYISPSYWDSLSADAKAWFRRSLSIGPVDLPHGPRDLLDDGTNIVDWRVRRRIVVEPSLVSEELMRR